MLARARVEVCRKGTMRPRASGALGGCKALVAGNVALVLSKLVTAGPRGHAVF